MCMCGLRLKTHYFPHTVHYCCSSMPRLSEKHWFLQSSSFWEARCALIGQLSSALWLAEYIKRETELLSPLTVLWCRVPARRHKNNINEAFVASSGDIIDYNDSYGLTRCAVPRRVNITPCLHLWSEKRQTTSTTLHNSKLSFESPVTNSLNKKMYLHVSQKRQTVLAKLELPHFIETAFVQASIVGYSFSFRK